MRQEAELALLEEKVETMAGGEPRLRAVVRYSRDSSHQLASHCCIAGWIMYPLSHLTCAIAGGSVGQDGRAARKPGARSSGKRDRV